MTSIQSALALQNYQTTFNWYTQTKNAKSSSELNKPYNFNFTAYSSSLFTDKVAGSLAKIIASANKLQATTESFRSTSTTLLNNRVVTSSDNTSITATASKGTDLQSVDISVQSVASAQTNSGAAFNAASPTALQTGTQKFSITTGNTTTQVSFYANTTDTHLNVLTKMKDAINSADSGVSAKVVKDPVSSQLHLEVTSKATGTNNSFSITDLVGSAVASTGIQSVTSTSSNASYRVNGGSLRTSNSNIILLDNGNITATLIKPTTNSVTLTAKPDSDIIVKQTKQLVKDYNALLAQISEESSYVNPAIKRNLDHALNSNNLDSLGISQKSDGTLLLDEVKLNNKINSQFDQVNRSLNGSNGITSALYKVTTRLGNIPAEALLNQNNSEYKQYNNYQATLEFYTQLPKTGLLLNIFY